jgi:CheY-like chemotaxis protein
MSRTERYSFMPLSGLFPGTPHPWTTRRAALNGAALRVLVVDDNHNAALAMAAYLGAEAIEARAVFGGLEAIDMGRAWAPHVILMDLTMPQCDGYEATRALRQEPRTDRFIIIAHTALDESEVRRHQVTGDEFDGYAQKGQPPALLLALLRILAT